MESPSVATSLKPLEPVGNGIYIYEPSGSGETDDGPSVIILCSAVLLITARLPELGALPFSVLHGRLAPAREAICRIVGGSAAAQQGRPSVLLHAFSHGGCNTAVQLARSSRLGHDPFELGPHIRGLVFDCGPGDTAFQRAYSGAAGSLPQAWPAQVIGRMLLYPAVGLITGLQRVGIMRSVEHLREQLNDPAVFGASARRLYLYSHADQLVGSKDVEWHMEDARSARLRGGRCRTPFPDSPHCALVRDDAVRYWDAIERL